MIVTVTAVIATVGRPTLRRAVQSILDQSRPVVEVIVVLDAEVAVDLPRDERIVVLRAAPGSGAASCRQLGVRAARGSVIALLDDDDEWSRDKLERQLTAIGETPGSHWIASSRVAAVGPGERRRCWPQRLIAPSQPVGEYLFRRVEIGAGGALLQTSTLVFPTALARAVPWDAHGATVHDEPTWLIEVQRRLPDVHIVQLPAMLSVYQVGTASTSRATDDRSDAYIDWGLHHLGAESARVLGDYLCTSPVSAAVAARSIPGVRRAVVAALRYGRPGPAALTYAALNAARIAIRPRRTMVGR